MGFTGRTIPLQRKIGLAVLAMFVVLAIVFGIVLVLLHGMHMRGAIQQSEKFLEMLVTREAESLANELFERRVRAVELRAGGILALEGLLSVTVYAANGGYLVHRDRAGKEVPDEGREVTEPTRAAMSSQGVWRGIPALLYQAPVLVLGEPIGFIRMSYSMAAVERQRRVVYFVMGILLAAGFCLVLVVLNRMLTITVSRPLTTLKVAMKRIEAEGPGEAVTGVPGDEIGDLIATFNRMSLQLREMLNTVQSEVAERKEAEAETRRLRNYLANIIDSMPSVLVGVDDEGRVTQWNQAAERATGIEAAEATGRSVDHVLPMLSRDLEKVKRAIRDRAVLSQSKVVRIVDGEARHEEVTVFPLTSDGIGGAVIRVDDVTERARIDEMMVQSEKMLSVGGLAAGMAHEINNPLGAILQASQNVLRRISHDLPLNAQVARDCGTSLDRVRDYLERREILTFLSDIRQSGERAAEIVSNMLSFSRKAVLEGTTTDLADLMDRTLSLAAGDYDLKKRYDFRQIEIVREYEPGLPPVKCQAGKIQQVFLNLLRNGAEAMKEGGEPGRTPRLVLRLMREGPMIRIEIEDNGPGMDDETRKRVFEPFFTTKPPGIGTGLGLSVSYFIVTENHGGSLSVASHPGGGSRFTIKLPVEGAGA
ncbi:MAG: ATP-binding protein [Syntrophobacteraceae bacterium]